jgi:hypothetical protein
LPVLEDKAKPTERSGGRLRRLATRIDELASQDEQYRQYARDMTAVRLVAAAELHAICREFVDSVNAVATVSALVLDPPEYTPAMFREIGPNLLQVSVRGRVLQVEYCATEELTSTEDFRVPYTFYGSVRTFNQELLKRNLITEQSIFYAFEKQAGLWRYFDCRTYHTGPFDQNYLVSLMEQLL